MIKRPLVRFVLCSLLVTACAPTTIVDTVPPDDAASPAAIFYLVRHAEAELPPYDTNPPNPHLRELGRARAEALVHTLDAEPVETVFSTDYHRTQETAAPLAAHLGVEVTSYDPRDLAAFAARLKAGGGRHVIVGHSNTTPALVAALGGEPGEPIQERWEYDRLYVVKVDRNGDVTTLLLRYGEPSVPIEEG